MILKYLLAAAAIAAVAVTKKSYKGYKLITVVPKTEEQVKILSEIWTGDDTEHLSLDFWSNPAQVGHKVDISVPPKSLQALKDLFAKKGIVPSVEIENIEDAIELDDDVIKAHAKASVAFAPGTVSYGAGGYDLQRYHSYDRIVQYLRDVNSQYPQITELIKLKDQRGRHAQTAEGRNLYIVQYLRDVNSKYPEITELIKLKDQRGRPAQTAEGRNLYVLKVGSTKKSNKPAYWIDSGIHAREWAASAMTPIIINDLVSKYNSDQQITKYVDSIDFYIMPFVNPDGYEYSRTQLSFDRMWRKNRSRNGRCFGVDLNRNWDSEFGGAGTSGDPCNLIFRGPSAFSEVESTAMKTFLEGIRNQLKAFVTAHAYSQMWFYPYASRKNHEPSNYKEVRALANAAARKLQNVEGTKYTVGTPANILYAATGGSMDWVKERLHTQYVFGLELRPLSSRIGFMLPERYIVPTALETWEGLKVVADELVNPGSVIGGGSSGGTSSNCRDGNARCGQYKYAGYCTNAVHQHYMETYCMRTCGLC